MFSRPSVCRAAQRVARRQPTQRRGLAAPASGSFQYQAGEAKGVKFASRDIAGPTTTLALVSKAGTRYQPYPGLTEGLKNFAFRSTERRSTLRIIRESELLGAELNPFHSRENLVLEAKFLRDDLPYFLELLAEVASSTKYKDYVYVEEVLPLIQMAHKRFLADPTDMAVNSAHSLAFHRGLGTPTASASITPITKYLTEETIEFYSKIAYAKPNFAIVANGAEQAEVSKWVGEFFGDLPDAAPADAPKAGVEQTKFYGGEERISHDGGNALVLGFPGSSSATGKFYKPEIAVLTSLFGGQSSIKWSSGFSLFANAAAPGAHIKTKSAIYSDAGLLFTTITGNAESVAKSAFEVVKVIQEVASGKIDKEAIQKAKAAAKFKELEYGEDIKAGLELTGAGLIHGNKPYQIDEVAKKIDAVSEEQLKSVAKSLLENKAVVSTVGDLFVLPYAQELGLNV
jgi:ubiquinol-cytochrome c reductase core subunit 2